ncbi:hypothetical protein BaRGS_00020992 [Batillaria attramentaria]|uniref:Uncharacterized protein n=1 Tax=Batillaria attramentaria TaxID=370345 RepID=A0ABD0KKK5_9CAEN
MAGKLFGAGVLVLSMLVLAVTVAEHDKDHASCHAACANKFLAERPKMSEEMLSTCLFRCEGDEGYVDVHGTSDDTQ